MFTEFLLAILFLSGGSTASDQFLHVGQWRIGQAFAGGLETKGIEFFPMIDIF